MRIFLDANILFAAALPKSRTAAFFAESQKHVALMTSVYAAEEARRNLTEKRPDALSHFERLLQYIGVTGVATASIEVTLAEKDIPVLGGAVASNATHLLTGDYRDFGVFLGKTVQGVKIVSPQLLADALEKKGWIKKIR